VTQAPVYRQEELAAAEAATEAAAYIRRSSAATGLRHKTKTDIVTDVDVAAEDIILSRLGPLFPDDTFVSEEAGITRGDSGRTWFIDPLDGTANFASGLPHYAVAVSLAVDDHPVCAVTLDVVREELFRAVAGGATTCNGRTVGPRPVDDLADALVGVQLPEPAWRTDSHLEHAVNGARGVRVSGSTALDLAWTAAGLLDVCLYRRTPSTWDWIGGELLVSQAGGAIGSLGAASGRELMVAGESKLVAVLCSLAPWQPR
jgi:myo-inositol-1(or 4)-monophosphatase